MCNNQCHPLHFIELNGSRDQPSAHEFTKYIGQPSPALLLESALAKSWLINMLKSHLFNANVFNANEYIIKYV